MILRRLAENYLEKKTIVVFDRDGTLNIDTGYSYEN
jgi:histidinol phosphatase-like enzyme